MPSSLSDIDRRHLVGAVAHAEAARHRTSPNPAVGCVIAHGETIIGVGATETVGGWHAEIAALADAGASSVAGATAYVTLAPCAHQGRTPPCADALIDAGIQRVVVALDDPNPAADGGLRRLRDAHLDVVVLNPSHIVARTVACQLEGFLTVVATQRPFITLKVAQSTDGRMRLADKKWITGVDARRSVHRWRSVVDGVLVGVATVIADDPMLTVRLVGRTCPSPPSVVIDSRLRTPIDAQIVRPGTIIITTDNHDQARRSQLVGKGVEIVAVAADRQRVDLSEAMKALAQRGMLNVFAEPGPILGGALRSQDLVDRLVVHTAVHDDDGPPTNCLQAPGGAKWILERSGGAGLDVIQQWLRVRILGGSRFAETR
ncbi:MAG: bifunctional diaminohydroxyphosphoribosylaminopyrimidine deaminase/5-amino-6-(5-phosphoribosylamino)uracil reductase RibD [Nitriliruptoraceae bacterium]